MPQTSTPAPAAPAHDLQAMILRLAHAAGFSHAGIAPVESESDSAGQRDYLEAWIAGGRAGEMEYLKRRTLDGELVRSSLQAVAPWARSVVVCVAPYHADAPLSTDPAPPDRGWIARYAWSGTRDGAGVLRPADYHKVLLARLRRLERALQAEFGDPLIDPGPRAGIEAGWKTWAYVDTGPVIERAWAARAGVGWTGKNTCTLNQELGSFFFLGVILTSLELPPEVQSTLNAALAADRCGSCTRCIDACPTEALIAPRQMDASRCISYLTIEKRGAIPEELRAGMGRQVFGCDICQDVCPWNERAMRRGPAVDPVMELRPELVNPPLGWLASLDEKEFGRAFYGSPVKRAKYAGLRRNVAVAMGNSGEAQFEPQLKEWARSEDSVLAEAAEWALRRLAAASAEDRSTGRG